MKITTLVVCLLFTTHLIYSQFQDDGPTAGALTPISGLSNSEFADIQLVVDESPNAQANPADNVADRESLADFSDLFGVVDYGTDGPGSSVFGLNITDNTGSPVNGQGSGLYAVDGLGQGAEILFFENFGTIEGRTGSSTGDLFFIISNTGSEITITQSSMNMWHPDSSNHNDSVSLNGMSGSGNTVTYSINLVQTITDADGDTVSAVLNLTEANASGGSAEYVFNFLDDGPSANGDLSFGVVTQSEFDDIQISVDESTGQQSNPEDNVSDRTSSSDFAIYFSADSTLPGQLVVDYGTDGSGSSVFELNITDNTGSPVNSQGSGLYAIDNADTSNNDGDGPGQGDEILLFHNNGVIEGRVGSAGGDLYFTVSNNGSEITITQSSMNMWHPDSSNHNDSVSLNGMSGSGNTVTYSINLVQTITDADGDSAEASLSLTQAIDVDGTSQYVFNFGDDAPSIDDSLITSAAVGSLMVDETDLGGVGGIAIANFASNFTSGGALDFGTDGAGSITYSLAVNGSNAGSGLYAIDNTDTTNSDGDGLGQGDEILLFQEPNGSIIGRTSSGGDIYFTIESDTNTGDVSFSILQAAWSYDPNNHDEPMSVNTIFADQLTLNAVITDADGDSDVAKLNLGNGVLVIEDDGPSITAAGILNAIAVLDESQLPTAGDGVYSASLNLASVFGVNSYGTDGAGSTSYSVSFDNTPGGISGLFILDSTSPDGKGTSIELVDQGNGTVKGVAGTSEVFTISVDASGVLTFEYSNQTDPANIWHGNITNHDENESINIAANQLVVTKSVMDADGDAVNQIIDIGQSTLILEDDGPAANNDMIFTDGAQSNNVVLIIDRSGSMGNDSGVENPNYGGNYSRMEVLQESIDDLLNSYEELGTLNVQIVSFADDNIYHGWFSSAANAMNIINSLTASGFTDYDDALQLTIDSYSNELPPSYADNTTLYFFSDGDPSPESNKQAILDFESTWESFLNNTGNDITDSYAVGIGLGIPSTEYLDVVSYGNSDTITDPTNPRFSGEDNTIIVEDFSVLSFVLMSTIQGSMGSVLDGSLSAGGMADNYGTDGAGQIIAFEHDGTVYSATSYGSSHTITTADGGTFTFYFEDVGVKSAGDFEYTASTGPGADVTEVITYSIQDADGDTASADLEIAIDREGVPVALIVPSIVLDEDDLPVGNNDAAAGDDNPSNVNGVLIPDYGEDGVGSLQLIAGSAPSGFSYSVSNGGLLITIMEGSTSAATFTLTESSTTPGNYSYEAVLLASITHQINGTEDNIDFPMSLKVIDGNGTSITSDFTLNIDDDLPVLNGSSIIGVVEEEQLVDGNEDTNDVNGLDTDTNGNTNLVTNIVAGSLASLIDAGSDGYGGFSFGLDLSVLPPLYSNGLAVVYSVSGNTLTANTIVGNVFELQLFDDGGYYFTLIDQLDHVGDNNGENIALRTSPNDNIGINAIDFSEAIKFIDGDGDSANLDSGMFQIKVIDDIPVAFDASICSDGTPNEANGNVVDGSLTAGGLADTYGTDGVGQIISFEHDGTVYSAASYGSSHTITTADGGTFTFYFEDVGVKSAGDFDYTASTGPGLDVIEVFTYTIQDADGDRASDNLEICVDHEVLAIEDVSFNNLNYYPNPVLNILYINNVNTITKTIFYDINGKKLLEEIHQSDNVELKVDKFKIGVYFLEIYSNNQTKILKIIKGE